MTTINQSEELLMLANMEVRDAAAHDVRALVTARLLEIIKDEPRGATGVVEATVVCRHLRHGQPEAAQVAHANLVRRVRHDLLDCGGAEPEHLALINGIQDYLSAEGWVWDDRQWLTDREHEAVLARRLVEAW